MLNIDLSDAHRSDQQLSQYSKIHTPRYSRLMTQSLSLCLKLASIVKSFSVEKLLKMCYLIFLIHKNKCMRNEQ